MKNALILAGLAAIAAPYSAAAAAAEASGMEQKSTVPGTPWPATDDLGRSLPLHDETGPVDPDKFIGIFYFLWNGVHDVVHDKVYDVAKILAADPDALSKPDSPLWGPHGHMHFWGEPLYGYYRNNDPWVIRRHLHLLADAGVDTLIFDTTNAVTYDEVYMAICEVMQAVRAEGGTTPQITFMLNTRAGDTARRLYETLYQPGLHEDLWFQWEGKPLLIADPAQLDDELKAFFTLRKAHWPFEMVNTPYAWHWEAAYPQPYGYTEDPDVPEQVNVSVAQNLRASDGRVTDMSSGDARGRSFHDGKRDTRPGAVNYGFNLAEQWERAYELDPPFVMITGWNEWVAGKWERDYAPIVFVDQYDQEFSRDIEPVKGLHGDNYYYQMVGGIRRFKGAPPIPEPSAPKAIDISGGFEQWRPVLPAFQDHHGETAPRDFPGVADTHYKSDTGRNEFRELKVARDEDTVYFYARTAAPITRPDGEAWMTLFISAGGDPQSGWEGYGFIVNRQAPGEDAALLEKSLGGWTWESVAEVPYRLEGNELHLAIPREALGLQSGTDALTLDFKWADHLQKPGDVMDFYVSGDVAPEGRFRYRYEAK